MPALSNARQLPLDLAFAISIAHPFQIHRSDKMEWSRSAHTPTRIVVNRAGHQAQIYPLFRCTFVLGKRRGMICLPSSRSEVAVARRLLHGHPRGAAPAGTFLVAKLGRKIVGCAVVAMLTYTGPPYRVIFLQKRFRKSWMSLACRKPPVFAWGRRFVVTRGWRGRGVGTALAKAVKQFVGQSWLPKCLAVETYTSEAERFLINAGYELVGISARSRKWYYATFAVGITNNELCPCESGKKYKKCHGRNTGRS